MNACDLIFMVFVEESGWSNWFLLSDELEGYSWSVISVRLTCAGRGIPFFYESSLKACEFAGTFFSSARQNSLRCSFFPCESVRVRLDSHDARRSHLLAE